jgi:hypothetical protein
MITNFNIVVPQEGHGSKTFGMEHRTNVLPSAKIISSKIVHGIWVTPVTLHCIAVLACTYEIFLPLLPLASLAER